MDFCFNLKGCTLFKCTEILCYLYLENTCSLNISISSFIFSKNIKISEARSHGEGFVHCWV